MDEEVYKFLPEKICLIVKKALEWIEGDLLEIRLRANQPLEIITPQKKYFLNKQGKYSQNDRQSVVTPKMLEKALMILSENSIYALERQLKEGFITIRGGHRVGFTGEAIVEKNKIIRIKNLNSINYRITRELKGVGSYLLKDIYDYTRNEIYNSLIISPPLCGKTTLLRDLIRLISSGQPSKKIKGFKVGLVDERSEIAGAYNGIPQNDVGPRTDLLDNCPKSKGILLLIRSMSPEVIAVDEIGSIKDVRAIKTALYTGVKVLATVHGKGLEEVKKRPELKILFNEHCFERFIVLSERKGVGTLEKVLNGKGGVICGGDN
ncbi:MAG: stage III sporulation protein AA [Halanaerobiales bacterium]